LQRPYSDRQKPDTLPAKSDSGVAGRAPIHREALVNSVIVVGSLNIDHVVHAPRHPEIGETILGSDFRTFFGGKGANQAVAASRSGASVSMVGKVGADNMGDTILNNLLKEGIDLTYLQRDQGAATGVAQIVVDDLGRNTIVVAPGANGLVTAEDIQLAQLAFSDASVLVLQLEIPLEAVETAVQLGVENNLIILLNPSPAQPLRPTLLRQVDYLVLNQSEVKLLSGKDELQAAIHQLQEWGSKTILVTLGEDGVLLIEGQTQMHLKAYAVKAVDTVGAGDAFVGAFAARVAAGATPIEAARAGNAAGALAITQPGAQSSLPYSEEIELLLEIDQT
jgi:ribokinase